MIGRLGLETLRSANTMMEWDRDDSSLAPVLPVDRAAAEWPTNCSSVSRSKTSTSFRPTTWIRIVQW